MSIGGAVLVATSIFIIALCKENAPATPPPSAVAVELELTQTMSLLQSERDNDLDEEVGTKAIRRVNSTGENRSPKGGAKVRSPRGQTVQNV
jgi:hypothetical protein